VSLDKLAKQLRRDIAANPKKAAALGLMVLVALYFWGPLLAKWVSAGGKRTTKMNPAALILTDDPAEPTQQSRARGKSKFHWDRVRQLMQQDPCMLPAKFSPAWVDPFAAGTLTIAEQQLLQGSQAPSESASSAPAAVDPEQFSIVLGGVFFGAHSRVATINGEACHENDTITVTGKDASLVQKLRVVHIRRQGVVVDLGGRLLTLELATPSLGQGDEIQRRKHESN
jgi:hypothetical protein